jgi:hypothetical protein
MGFQEQCRQIGFDNLAPIIWYKIANIDYYVNSHRKRERIGLDKKLADAVLKKRKVEIAEGKYLDKK